MRKPRKSILLNHVLEASFKESTKAAGTCFIDGGNLLQNMPWVLPCTYTDRDIKPFFQLLFKSSQCHQMKVLNERISEWPHLML